MDLDVLWDIYQELEIQQVRGAVDAVAAEVADRQGSVQADVQQMSERVDRLALLCRAMHELLKQNGAYTDTMLRDKVVEIDMRDGRRDGKYTPPPKKCPKCGAMICRKFNRCLFCGYQDSVASPFHQAD